MRQACLWMCLCLVCACADDDAQPASTNAKSEAGPAKSTLRPELLRAPTANAGLPAELRPPR